MSINLSSNDHLYFYILKITIQEEIKGKNHLQDYKKEENT